MRKPLGRLRGTAGFTLIELGIALLILIVGLLIAYSLLQQGLSSSGGGQPASGTSFTVRGDWVQAPTVIGNNVSGDVVYGVSIGGTGISGVTIRYTIERSSHVLVVSTLQNQNTTYDTSVSPTVATTTGEMTTDASGQALLKLSHLSNGSVTVTATVVDPAGGEHDEPVKKNIEVDDQAQTQY